MCLSLSNQDEDVGWDDRQAEVNQNYGPLRAYVPSQREKVSNFKIQQKDEKFSIMQIGGIHPEKDTNMKPLHEKKIFKKLFLRKIILRDPIL